MTFTLFAKKRIRNTVIATAALLLPLTLSSCGGAKLTLDEAAVEPCRSFQIYIDYFLAGNMGSAATQAAVASKQFSDLSSDYPQFATYARVLEGATDTGTVDDLSGYVKLLGYCNDINKGTK
jgi:hypothetical protein